MTTDRQRFPFALPEDAQGRDRLADLGRLAGSLVHELKNPLGVIMLNTELLLAQAPWTSKEAERAQKRLTRILDSSRNLQAIVQGFLNFAKPSRPDRDAVDVNGLLRLLLDEQADEFEKARIKLSFHPDPDLSFLPADPLHLRSIFLNVLVNAREALLDRADDRRLLVVTRSGPEMVRVVIANNGPPLTEDVASHLFEPFHSSKETGTGLGLAIVHRLVELHHGTVTVSSDPDQGVSFAFEFPTPLGPAHPRTQLPLPDVEAVVRDETARIPRKPRRAPARRRPPHTAPDAGQTTPD